MDKETKQIELQQLIINIDYDPNKEFEIDIEFEKE